MKSQLFFPVLLFAILPIFEANPQYPFGFGPETVTVAFKGRVTENGRPVPAYLSLEVLYRVNGQQVPISLVQVNSLSNYELRLSTLIFQNSNLTNHAILRVQSLSAYGGSTSVKVHLKDHKVLYENNVELRRYRRPQPNDQDSEDDEVLNNVY